MPAGTGGRGRLGSLVLSGDELADRSLGAGRVTSGTAILRGVEQRTVLRGARSPGDIAVEGGRIAAVGTVDARPGDRVLRCDGDLVTAGFVNTHHHLYQWMTRGRATACDLFTWLTTLYPVWGRISVEDTAAAALVGLGELALCGATTVSDHHYVVPRGEDTVFDAIAAAARTVGVRLRSAADRWTSARAPGDCRPIPSWSRSTPSSPPPRPSPPGCTTASA